jgi:hypothetical protein
MCCRGGNSEKERRTALRGHVVRISDEAGFAGTISFQENFKHYVAAPLVIQGAAETVFAMKDIIGAL